MNKFLKFFIISNPLQGFRIVDTFPWMMLLSEKKLRVKYREIPLLFFCFVMVFATAILGNDLLSVGKISLFFGSIFLAILSKKQYLQISIRTFFVLLLLLAIEDLLINYAGLISPFVRDDEGGLFIFREKSYAALLVGYLLSYLPVTRRNQWRDLLVIAVLFFFLSSALGWLIYALYLYQRIYLTEMKIPSPGLLFLVLLLLIYLAFVFIDSAVLRLVINYSDSLRFLINLESFHMVNVGSIYMHDTSAYQAQYVDIKSDYFLDWGALTPQAPFFILSYFFGYFGFMVGALFFLFYMKAFPRNRQDTLSLMHSMVFINIFLQGFMFSPYLIGYLFITNRRDS